jgi:hypothetical protein
MNVLWNVAPLISYKLTDVSELLNASIIKAMIRMIIARMMGAVSTSETSAAYIRQYSSYSPP